MDTEFLISEDEWEEARVLRRVLNELKELEGWKKFINILQKNREARKGSLLEELKDIPAVLNRQFIIGEIQGIDFAINLLDTLIEAAEYQIESYVNQENLRDG